MTGQFLTVHCLREGGSPLAGSYYIPLLGHFQQENATTAVAALHILQERGFHRVAPAAVREGLRSVEWPGRMEVMNVDPLIVVDCAHNPYSTEVLRKALREWFPGRKWVVIFGASADKDIAGMLEALKPITDYLIVTRSDHPRAATPVELADLAASVGVGAEIAVNIHRAFQRALAILRPKDGILVTGSIFLVAEAREEWARENGCPVPERDG